MSQNHPQREKFGPPWVVWGFMLLVISFTEYGVMLLLPRILPVTTTRLWESAVDSILLTAIVSPMMWWIVVRPLKDAARLRKAFVIKLIDAMERERRRIAYELHDCLGQSLTLVISGLRSLPDAVVQGSMEDRICELTVQAQRALADAKQLALGLRPSLLDDLGLAPAIERLSEEIRRHHGISVRTTVNLPVRKRLGEAVETAVFRICQESLNNVVKHSGATEARITLSNDTRSVTLEVGDNGRGMDRSRTTSSADHLGLLGMRERTSLLGGEFRVDSAPWQGTRIAVTIPLEAT